MITIASVSELSATNKGANTNWAYMAIDTQMQKVKDIDDGQLTHAKQKAKQVAKQTKIYGSELIFHVM